MFLPLALLATQQVKSIFLSDLDLTHIRQGWGSAQRNKSVDGNPIRIAGQGFGNGIGTHAVSNIKIALDGRAIAFTAFVGVDDEIPNDNGDVDFHVFCDGVEKFNSGKLKKGDGPIKVSVPLKGVKLLTLKAGNGGDEIDYDHADWAMPQIDYSGKKPIIMVPSIEKPYILTPKPPKAPRINGPKRVGARANREFVWKIPATGQQPMTYSVSKLPDGLKLSSNGVISGTTPANGTYELTLVAKNAMGRSTRKLSLVIGDKLALTPPMGWNSWNCFANAVDEQKVLDATKAFVNSGLINHGWQYINIDDCWSIVPNSNDPIVGGATRDQNGEILTNKKFPNMKALTDKIHSYGLRAGIYSSPGPTTCGGYAAFYGHEEQDIKKMADWGFDYIKYDWCSYSQIQKPEGLDNLKKPYEVMQQALKKVNRDIVYSLCQYGMGDVWKWGESVGGNCWRTTGDITDSWESLSGIGFSQDGHEKFAGPGHWNDPDMLVVGWVGWGPQLHPTRLTPSEQYTHISLWSLLSSPLLIGCDMTRLDEFTLNLLTNDEVIAVNQDPLGKPAHRISMKGDIQVWGRNLEDGSMAIGIFNLGDSAVSKSYKWSELGTKPAKRVRDLWRQRDMGRATGSVNLNIRSHGCSLIRVWS